jgi:hypothetical protein
LYQPCSAPNDNSQTTNLVEASLHLIICPLRDCIYN